MVSWGHVHLSEVKHGQMMPMFGQVMRPRHGQIRSDEPNVWSSKARWDQCLVKRGKWEFSLEINGFYLINWIRLTDCHQRKITRKGFTSPFSDTHTHAVKRRWMCVSSSYLSLSSSFHGEAYGLRSLPFRLLLSRKMFHSLHSLFLVLLFRPGRFISFLFMYPVDEVFLLCELQTRCKRTIFFFDYKFCEIFFHDFCKMKLISVEYLSSWTYLKQFPLYYMFMNIVRKLFLQYVFLNSLKAMGFLWNVFLNSERFLWGEFY